ncbi:S1 family peptidase [Embleya sp. AB8]|uniref:S1 family peptidase n=1 Tax=Embleya sp. AB8 TaxID=3156304 RepID=UPI003C74C1C9
MIRSRHTQDTRRPRPARVFGAAAVALATLAICAPSASAVRNGSTAPAGAAPYAVALFTADGQQLCGGTLVTSTKVLTAAHCVMDVADPTGITVVAARVDLTTSNGSTRKVTRARVHPRFVVGTLTYDAAVLELNRPLADKTLPIAGAKDDALYTLGRKATVYGWGKRDGGVPTTRQQRTTLVLSPPAACDPYTFPGDTTATKVCGLPPADNPGTSVCKGDSGGPLVAGGKLIGIVSSGNMYCSAEQPRSVFTRASAVTGELGL